MKPTIKIDTSNFNRAVNELARMSGVNLDEVLRGEVAAIIAQTIYNTPAAKKSSIEKALNEYVWIRRSGGTWKDANKKVHTGGTIYPQWRHYSDDLWQDILSNKQARMRELIRRIGITKQSWLRIAKDMGLKMPPKPKIPAYVATSAVAGKTFKVPASHSKQQSGGKIAYKIENFSRVAIAGNGRKALLKAINGRTGFYYRNLRLGVFKKASEIAKKYPGMKVVGI